MVTESLRANREPDDIVNNFSIFITDRANPYFQKKYKSSTTANFGDINPKEKQLWYNAECVRKHSIYTEAVYNFNLHRNEDTRKMMMAAKKDYKYCCRSSKQKYRYEQGRRMNEFKKKQPREFWKLFKSKTKTNEGQDIPITDFHEYFRTLSNQGNAFSNPEVDTFMQDFESSDRGDPAFGELDEPISQEEIKKA